MSDIFSEVDEDLRREQWRELWDRFGGYVIGAAIAIVVGTAGTQFWQARDQAAREEAAVIYLSGLRALDADNAAGAQAQFEKLSNSGHDGYAALARHEQASGQLRGEEVQAAIATLDSIVDDSGISEQLRGVAAMKAALLAMDVEDADAIAARLAPMAVAGEPFEFLARELLAVNAYRDGDIDTARDGFANIVQNPLSSYGARQRSLEMLAVMGPADVTEDDAAEDEKAIEDENGDSAK